jgi:Xaa-Pro dipeptidase
MSQFVVNYRNRQNQLGLAMRASNIDVMALNAGPSFTYLTGLHFHLSERPVVGLFTPDLDPVIILPEFEAGKLSDLPYQVESFTYGEDPDTWQSTFREGVQSAGLSGKRVGVEPRRLRVLELRFLEKAAEGIKFVSGENSLSEMRMLKDEAEQANMQKAVNIAQNALESMLSKIKPGITERELASELVVRLLREGSESKLPFSPIVASGPNSANPHAFPSERRIERGDLLIIDWGANIGGYFSDLTRTFAIGEPQDEIIRIAGIVFEANEAASDKASPGIPAQDVDRAARKAPHRPWSGHGKP